MKAISGQIELSGTSYRISFLKGNTVTTHIMASLPLTSEAHNIGGEIYFRANGVDIAYDGTQREEFEIGDVVYWRSPNDDQKFAVALLYGNTQYSNWTSPKTSSPCVKIGSIMGNLEGLASIPTGVLVRFFLYPTDRNDN